MFRFFQKFNPPVMQKIDNYLLLHYPNIWATHIHYVLAGIAAYTLLLLGVATIYPLSFDNLANAQTHFYLSLVPALIGFCVWLYRINGFNVEMQFGKTNLAHQLLTQLLILGGTASFFLPSVFYGNKLSNRIAHKTTIEQVAKDYQEIEAFRDLMLQAYRGDYNGFYPNISYNNPNRQDFEALFRINNYENIVEPAPALEETSSDVPSMQEEVLPKMSEEKKLSIITHGIASYNKWSPKKIMIPAEEVANPNEIDQYHHDMFNRESTEPIRSNLNSAVGSIYKDYIFQRIWSHQELFIFLSFLPLALLVFMKTGFLNSLYTVLGAMISGTVAWAIIMTSQIFIGHIENDLTKGLFWLFLVMFLVLGYSSRNTKRFLLIKKAMLSIAAVAMTFVPLLAWVTLDEHPSSFDYQSVNIFPQVILTAGVCFAFFIWNSFLNRRIQTLQASPSQN